MKVLVLLIFLSLLIGCDTESSIDPRYENYFVKYYGEEGNQEGVDVQLVSDGFIILGNSTSADGNQDIVLIKADHLGNQQWINSFGGERNEEAVAMEVDASGNLIIAATVNMTSTDRDVMILKIAPDGVQIDSAVFGSVGKDDVANDILVTQDGDYILTGYTTNVDTSKPGYLESTDLQDIYSVRTTPDLVQVDPAAWRRVYGFPGIDRGVGLMQKTDGSFLFFGTTNKPPTTNSQQAGFNMFLFPAAADGIAVSTAELQLFGTLSDETASKIIQTGEGGFIMLGTSTSAGLNQLYMARVRNNNDFVSAGVVAVNGNVEGTSIAEASSGGFLILGEVLENNNANIALSRVASNGSIGWQKTFGGVDNDGPGTIIELENGEILFVGTVTLESQTKICLIKVTNSGELKP
ncbi:hypothetical protein JMN32_26995 [Fulvivirga sp. 29W222]|uniref:Uncharacterized protein n=1 Tax=Fulvivirga marina TaxID=2494733 RepID=A0A937KH00_9BACT|nr:hypothetical protein [Fulvivirga marina]MBL6449990.1 hypothetical protein [Fulvivirga marina]